ncbi:MAG: aminoacyl-tRNA hydrolase [Ruminococcus sp.]|nr:aminoacyl-tRNA hydrolase [Ruminococcus sp.]
MSIWDIFNKLEKEKTVMTKPEFLIVGLGNPGIQYEETRHNAGFLTIDRLCEKLSFDVKKAKFKSYIGEVSIGGKCCLVMKPQTYMNNSGEAVIEAMDFYKIPIENVLVIYDDISLEPSKMRIRRKGSHGGHNGIRSIVEYTGSEEFPRIKMGVGKKPHPDYNLADWVLSRFTEDELKAISPALDNACEAIKLIASGEIDKAMNSYNS